MVGIIDLGKKRVGRIGEKLHVSRDGRWTESTLKVRCRGRVGEEPAVWAVFCRGQNKGRMGAGLARRGEGKITGEVKLAGFPGVGDEKGTNRSS